MGIKATELLTYTPREFENMYLGWLLLEKRKARYIQFLLSPHVKRMPSIADILGFEEEEIKSITPAEKRQQLQEMKRLFGEVTE
ncbi:hypothetical protein [Ectobacillus ponti]|uniref:Uncharacterized protein n=1 Tax=Ectobacillus ponti TaxID=2961894 RepID=A0AA41X7Z3_9BACI|nr:hypothetical protein [Ectobacillus ponti]MCP8970574.1 hypothetical protein [Ectobacillus ponti]